MHKITKYSAFLFLFLVFTACAQPPLKKLPSDFATGPDQIDKYLPLLLNKNVALVVNHTSLVGKTHLADTLQRLGVKIKTIFAPEHGFRGTASDGELVANNIDTKTGIPLISLYGKTKKPLPEHLKDIDVVIFDIQDVGVRFYTYPTTMHYVMEACAENNKKLIVLDRPNPNGRFIDGPILDLKFRTMVGWNPTPVLHGLTMAELALMINGEGWLEGKTKCDLQVIENKHYTHDMRYILPVAPSPNLPNQQSINLYAALCLFEAMDASIGRGTDKQFQIIGSPDSTFGKFSFIPEPKSGSINPPLKGKKCYGIDLTKVPSENLGFSLKYVIDFLKKSKNKEKYINNIAHFDRLAGSDILRKQLIAGLSEKKIKATWQKDLLDYKKMREKYRIYPD
ncbi:MAG: DUF1343 domain-containing protein [Bacteroidota bacterium]